MKLYRNGSADNMLAGFFIDILCKIYYNIDTILYCFFQRYKQNIVNQKCLRDKERTPKMDSRERENGYYSN